MGVSTHSSLTNKDATSHNFRVGIAVVGAVAMATAGAAFGAGTASADSPAPAAHKVVVTQAEVATPYYTDSTGYPDSGFSTDIHGVNDQLTHGVAQVIGSAGTGALTLSTPAADDQVQVLNRDLKGKNLSTLTDLSYDALVLNNGGVTGSAPAFKVVINPHKDGVTFATLAWEPRLSATPSVLNKVQTFTPSSESGWRTSKPALGIEDGSSFAQVQDALDGAEIISVGVGQGTGQPGLLSQVDNVKVNTTSYDFEVNPPLPADANADLQVGLDIPFTSAAGGDVTATVTVTNNGATATGPTKTSLILPAGYAVSDFGGATLIDDFLGTTAVWGTAYLAKGQSVTYSVKLVAPEGISVGLSAAYSFSETPDANVFNNFALGLTFGF